MKCRLALLGLIGGLALSSADDTSHLEERGKEIIAGLGGWVASAKPEKLAVLNDAERKTLIEFFRAKWKQSEGPEADERQRGFVIPEYRQRLLYLGDPNIIAEEIEVITKDDIQSHRYEEACSELGRAARPETIPLLMPRVFADEPLVFRPSGGDIGGSMPRSYGVTYVILKIAASSPAFSSEVQSWARDNGNVSPKTLLPIMRKWWRRNEGAFKASRYDAVEPGEDASRMESEMFRLVDQRRREYILKLAAAGKDSNDEANWKEWQENLLPRLMAGEDLPVAPLTPAPLVRSAIVPKPVANSESMMSCLVAIGVVALGAILWLFLGGRKRKSD